MKIIWVDFLYVETKNSSVMLRACKARVASEEVIPSCLCLFLAYQISQAIVENKAKFFITMFNINGINKVFKILS